MQRVITNSLRALLRGRPPMHTPILVILAAFLIFCGKAQAQLNGTYTIGPGESFTTIDNAITALTSQGVSGPVTFLLTGGNYIPPSTGYVLPQVASMNATNTVTFRPMAGATVKMDGTSSTAIFDFSGGDYYILDGANFAGGSTRNWTILNSSTSGRAIRFINGATNNIVRNMHLMGNATGTTTGGVILFSTSSAGGNSNNRIVANTIGDSAGVERSAVGIAASGSASANINENNVIEDNYLINYGIGTGTGYGMYMSTNNRKMKILRNRITLTETTGITGTKYGIYVSNSTNGYDTIAYNRIWKLNTSSATTAQYAIYLSSTGPDPMWLHHNMISLVAESGTLGGIYAPAGDIKYIEHNSIYIAGSSTSSTTSYNIYNSSSTADYKIRNNILVNMRTSTGSNTNRVLYNSSATATILSDHNIFYTSGNSTVLGYNGGTYYSTLPAWQAATSRDANSYFGSVVFVNTDNADLHIVPTAVFIGEGVGTPLGYPVDIDGQAIDPVGPDIGADEGNFNGGGIRVVAPNGGERFPTDDDIDVEFTLNRPLEVRVQFSTDGGATWVTRTTMTGVKGLNTVSILTASQPTTQALVRVISTRHQDEMDISNNRFELVLPVFTLLSPNGGERLVPTDTITIRWTSEFTRPTSRLRLEFSPNNGASWIPLDSGIVPNDVPGINTRKWIIPNIQTTQGIIRVKNNAGTIEDRSNATFTIIPQPEVTLLNPPGGTQLFAGDEVPIRWSSVTTEHVLLEYSTNGGAEWHNVVPAGIDIPAYLGEYVWTVPNVVSNNVLLRIRDTQRPRFNDASDAPLSINRSLITLLAPNGGEKYEIGQPITVSWTSQLTQQLRLEYSSDNGFTWTEIRRNIDPAIGSVTFTPPLVPTRAGLVRIMDQVREEVVDQSNSTFEIMPGKAITVYAPAAGDQFTRGSTTVISWDAPRIANVSIQYSPNGGINWQTLVPSMNAAQGNYTWAVPNQTTTSGKIRVTEVGGSIIAESGIFSVVEQAQPTLRVIYPDGGESFTEGETVGVRWTASGLNAVALHYSTDGGDNWLPIHDNIPATQGQYQWTITSAPGTEYRVRVMAANAQDMSDGNFTVRSNVTPQLLLIYPNGGERLRADSTIEVLWNAQSINGTVDLEYSLNGGDDWMPMATVIASMGKHSWNLPETATEEALVRISETSSPNALRDTSDAVFEIYVPEPEPIVVVTPNGGEIWDMATEREITWTAPDDVTMVDIYYSNNGGGNWQLIQDSVPSVPGQRSYNWMLPTLPATVPNALVRVWMTGDTDRQDVSNAVFTMRLGSTSVNEDAVAGSGMRLLGNYPNPFSGTTEVRWMQSRGDEVELSLFRQDGRQMGTYDLGRRDAGEQRYMLKADGIESGTYLYELRIGATSLRGVMVVVR